MTRLYEALRGVPPVTGALLAAISVVFALETLAGGASNRDTLIAFGASLRSYFLRGEWWRLVMPMFLHLSVPHLLLNLVALYIFGPPLERAYGSRRFSLIYLVSGMGGSLASMLLSRQMGAGASGAIMGVCGALAVTGYVRPWALPPELRPKCRDQILTGIVLTLAVGIWIPHIDNWAHLGGVVVGAALALGMRPRPGFDPALPALGWSLAVPLCIVCFSMAAVANYYGLSRQVVGLEAAGNQLLAEGSTEAAAVRFRMAQQAEPSDERPYEALGIIYSREKEWGLAITEYSRALALATNPRAARITRERLHYAEAERWRQHRRPSR